MSINSAEKMNFKLLSTGDQLERKPCDFNILTIKELLKWIDEKDIDEKVKEELKKKCSNYPQQALSNWKNNYNTHLTRAIKKIKKQDNK